MLKIKVRHIPKGISRRQLVNAGQHAMSDFLTIVMRDVLQNLSGRVLQRRTGRLFRSINRSVTTHGNIVRGSIGSPVIYSRIHEYGGIIRTRRATIRIPKRAYLSPAFQMHKLRGLHLIQRHINRLLIRR
jgi:phage gpG-like protein